MNTTSGAGQIRVGVVGLGRSGWGIHCTALPQMPEKYRIVAVTDPIVGRAEQSARDLGCRRLDGFEQMLADREVELVVVASPNSMHASQVEQVLKAGKHALSEKPFGLSTVDADRMIAAAKAAGVVLQPFQQRRYEPDFRKVQEICDSGLLGAVQFVRICWHGFKRRWDWQTLKDKGGGTMNNNGPHLVDHALELFGGEQEPEEVWCEMRRCLCSGDAEDHFKMILRGTGRPTVEVELTDTFAFSQDRWFVAGTRGGLRGDANGLEWKWTSFEDLPDRPVQPQSTPDRSYNSEQYTWKTQTWKPAATADAGGGTAPAQQPVVDLYTDLFATIRHGKPQAITPQSVRKRVAVMERARLAGGFYQE